MQQNWSETFTRSEFFHKHAFLALYLKIDNKEEKTVELNQVFFS